MLLTWGFTDIGGFRRLEFSSVVLRYYNVWAKYCTGRSFDVAMELIRDITDTDQSFPVDISEAVRRYGPDAALSNPQATTKLQYTERETNANYLAATLIYRLTESLESEPIAIPGNVAEETETKISNDFFKTTVVT